MVRIKDIETRKPETRKDLSHVEDAARTRIKYLEQLDKDGHDHVRYSQMFNVLYQIGYDEEGIYSDAIRIKAANAYLARLNELRGLTFNPSDSLNFNFVVVFDRDYAR